MKKLLLTFLTMFAVMAVNAAEVAITTDDATTWTTGSDATYGDGYVTTVDGVFFGLYKYGNNVAIPDPTGSQIRHYKNSMVVIRSTAGESITNVVFTCATTNGHCNDMTINGETVTADTENKTITWSGQATEILAEANVAQNRYLKVVVTTTEGGEVVLSAPKFSPEGGTYYAAQNVTLSAVTGAEIYYTTNGDTPTTSSFQYDGNPIEVTTTTTIKAIASLNGETSEVAEATYTIAEAAPVANIAEFVATAVGTIVEFTNPVTCVFQDGSNTYVKDETGWTLIYGSLSTEYAKGDIIPAGFCGERVDYNDAPQLTAGDYASTFKPASGNNGEVEAVETAVGDVTADMSHRYVKLAGVTVEQEPGSSEGQYNYYAVSGSDRVMLYSRFSTVAWSDLAALDFSLKYDVVGFVTSYKGEVEIYVEQIYEAGTQPGGGDEPFDGIFYEESLVEGDGNFTFQDVDLGGLSWVWSYDDNYHYWKASAYVSGTNHAAESWLVTPEIDLTNAATAELQYKELLNFLSGNPADDFCTVQISDNYVDDVTSATWTQMNVTNRSAGTSWDDESVVDPIDLAQFVGKKIRVAFKYASTSSCAPTWEIFNIVVSGTQASSSVDDAAVEDAARAIGLDGEIAIIGNATDVEVYTIGGALMSKGEVENIPCAAGIYIVKVDGKAQKVIVK